METVPLLAVGFGMKLVAGLFVLCALCLILIVLVQKGKGGGLGAAFGGGGGGGGLLGTKTGDFLTWVTIVLAGTFLLLSVVMAKWYRPSVTETQQPQQQQGPADQADQSMPDVTEIDDAGTETEMPADMNE